MLGEELRKLISWINPEVCFGCNKCVSGCPVAEIHSEYRPNRIVRLAYLGFIDELIESGVIWYCTQCLKCSERCPMEVYPASVVVALRNIASKRGKTHEAWIKMAKNIALQGKILPEMGVMSIDRKLIKRKDLGIEVPNADRSLLIRILRESGIPLDLGE